MSSKVRWEWVLLGASRGDVGRMEPGGAQLCPRPDWGGCSWGPVAWSLERVEWGRGQL